jgi:hypothetical protein
MRHMPLIYADESARDFSEEDISAVARTIRRPVPTGGGESGLTRPGDQ